MHIAGKVEGGRGVISGGALRVLYQNNQRLQHVAADSVPPLQKRQLWGNKVVSERFPTIWDLWEGWYIMMTLTPLPERLCHRFWSWKTVDKLLPHCPCAFLESLKTIVCFCLRLQP